MCHLSNSAARASQDAPPQTKRANEIRPTKATITRIAVGSQSVSPSRLPAVARIPKVDRADCTELLEARIESRQEKHQTCILLARRDGGFAVLCVLHLERSVLGDRTDVKPSFWITVLQRFLQETRRGAASSRSGWSGCRRGFETGRAG